MKYEKFDSRTREIFFKQENVSTDIIRPPSTRPFVPLLVSLARYKKGQKYTFLVLDISIPHGLSWLETEQLLKYDFWSDQIPGLYLCDAYVDIVGWLAERMQ